ncbi:sigma-54-dependent response regulator transcription factor FleR [Haliea atlantica]
MQHRLSVLIVEDDATLREALCDTVRLAGDQVLEAADGEQALRVLATAEPDLVITDVQMDRMGGAALLRHLRRDRPELPVVMITAHGSVRQAVEAMQEGASDYLLKPFEAEVLLSLLERFRLPSPSVEGMVAESPAMLKICQLLTRVACSDATVLLSGESGVGKEVVARYLHRCSDRADGPFVAINCAAIPENMLEAMLFGYEKGAYTGAHQARPGKFETADGGTLLLDEISEMDLGLQAKLLRVLQEREVERLGGNTPIPLDVRVVATTNRDLGAAVAAGEFREDLYYRLNVIPVQVPPLRDRAEDIPALARTFLARFTAGRPLRFSPEALARLQAQPWRGNVRELQNCIQRAALLAEGGQVSEAVLRQALDLGGLDTVVQAATPDSKAEHLPSTEVPQLDGRLKAHEREMIVSVLSAVNGSRKKAAEQLGISPRTLRYKLARLREMGHAV